MIKTTGMLLEQYSSYANPAAKIARLVKGGSLTPIVRGLYETDSKTPGHYLAGAIYGPSYLSFEYALAHYDLIPETVFAFTCATCGKGRRKHYETPFGTYLFRDVPVSVFRFEVDIRTEDGYAFILATPEKAICDELYTCSPCANRAELRDLLFDELRIDDEDFLNLDLDVMAELAGRYKTKNHRLLISLIGYLKRHR